MHLTIAKCLCFLFCLFVLVVVTNKHFYASLMGVQRDVIMKYVGT